VAQARPTAPQNDVTSRDLTTMGTGTGDGLMQLLRQIADDLDELRTEERRHVSVLERTTKRVWVIETLCAEAQVQQAADGGHLHHVRASPRIDSGPAADVRPGASGLSLARSVTCRQ
jgi:hypothetical protein